MNMSTRVRKAAIIAHVVCSVGWIGAVAAFLVLAVVGLRSHEAYLVRAAYLAMGVTAWEVIVPLAFAAVITGAASSLGTPWGLFRYYWIVFKLLITAFATFVLLIHMRLIDALAEAAARTAVLAGAMRDLRSLMVLASSLAIVALIVVTALSVYKPRGVTPWAAR